MSESEKPAVPRWAVEIPKDVKPLIFVMSPKVGETRRAIILSERPIGAMTHWYNKRTIRCTKDEGECPGCGVVARRYKGYLAGWDLEKHRYVLVEITAQASVDNNKLLGKDGPNLRGLNIYMRRHGRSAAGRLLLEFTAIAGRDPSEVPEAFDVGAALERIWAGESKPKPVPKPVPPPEPDEEDDPLNDIPLPRTA